MGGTKRLKTRSDRKESSRKADGGKKARKTGMERFTDSLRKAWPQVGWFLVAEVVSHILNEYVFPYFDSLLMHYTHHLRYMPRGLGRDGNIYILHRFYPGEGAVIQCQWGTLRPRDIRKIRGIASKLDIRTCVWIAGGFGDDTISAVRELNGPEQGYRCYLIRINVGPGVNAGEWTLDYEVMAHPAGHILGETEDRGQIVLRESDLDVIAREHRPDGEPSTEE